MKFFADLKKYGADEVCIMNVNIIAKKQISRISCL